MTETVAGTTIRQLVEQAGFEVLETATVQGRTASHAQVPDTLDPRVVATLEGAHPQGLYSHQAESLAVATRGEDICLATSTASGKSLVFMATALNILLRDRFARVVALYPAKALIQDQLDKWHRLLDPLLYPHRLYRWQRADGTAGRDSRIVASCSHDPRRDTRLADEPRERS